MPAHEPTVFGVDEQVPTGVLRQLAWPFKKSSVVPAIPGKTPLVSDRV